MKPQTITAGRHDTVYAYRGDHVILTGPATGDPAGHAKFTRSGNWARRTAPTIVNTAADTKRFLEALGVYADENDAVILYKTLPASMVSGQQYGHTTSWEVGCTTVCDDWDYDWVGEGRALHLSPTKEYAQNHYNYNHPDDIAGGTTYACRAFLYDVHLVPEDWTQYRCKQVTVLEEAK